MRKSLFYLALVLLAGLWTLTFEAIYGRHPLPARIPTHFDMAGNVNGWGEPRMLWLFPIVASAMFGLMTLVGFFPQSFNFPTRVTPATRPRLEVLSLQMIAGLRAELAGLFLGIQYIIIQSARAGTNRLSPLFVPAVLLVVFGTIGGYLTAMLRTGRTAA